jgi:hypothetical protein
VNLQNAGAFIKAGATALGVGGELVDKKAIKEKKLQIPQDISVVSYEDANFASYLSPPLTTLPPSYEIGKAAAAEGRAQFGDVLFEALDDLPHVLRHRWNPGLQLPRQVLLKPLQRVSNRRQ